MAAILSLDPIITTTLGKVRGRQRQTIYDDKYFCFDGVPYAKPPLGELRFKAPQAAEPWTGVLDCTEVKPKCLQYNRYSQQIEGSEDCLYLNIYIKSFHTSKPLPVMVYIHGGMFSTGDHSRNGWGPEYFMMKEVVLITIGHRLGPLGFLSLKDPSLKVPGNACLKDQVAALKWIRANIAFFNGDPNNITVFGHSSGAMSTHLLMLNPQCIGLFHKAIVMASYFLETPKDLDLAYRLAKHIGYEGEKDDEKEILKFLTNIEGSKLLNNDLLTSHEKDLGYFQPFTPCMEPYASEDSILLKPPIELLQNTWSNKIPIMIGNTSNESLLEIKKYSTDEKIYERYKNNPTFMLPRTLQFESEIEKQLKVAEKIKKLHYGDKPLTTESALCQVEYASYRSFYHPCHRFLMARRAKRENARTYLYRFDFDSPNFNLYRIKHCGPDVRGCAHVDELSYMFLMPQSFKLSRDSEEFNTILRMIDFWTNFAATSNPNGPLNAPVVWEPLERNKPEKPTMCLNISNDLTFQNWPEAEKCAVWDSAFEECGVKLY